MLKTAKKIILQIHYIYITNTKNIDLRKSITYNEHKRKEFVENTNENVISIWNLAFGNWNTNYQLPNAKC